MNGIKHVIVVLLAVVVVSSTPVREYLSEDVNYEASQNRDKRYFDKSDDKGHDTLTSPHRVIGSVDVNTLRNAGGSHNSKSSTSSFDPHSKSPDFRITYSTSNKGGLGASPDGSKKGPTVIKEINRNFYIYNVPPQVTPDPIYVENSEIRQRKQYHIVFIKSPAAPTPKIVLPELNSVNLQKTLVYFLQEKAKAPEISAPKVKSPDSEDVSKPEVFFIKYDNEEEKEEASETGSSEEEIITNRFEERPSPVSISQLSNQGLRQSSVQNILQQVGQSASGRIDEDNFPGRFIPVSLDDIQSGKLGNVRVLPVGRVYRDTDS